MSGSNPVSRARILIVSRYKVHRAGLGQLLTSCAPVEVAGEAESPTQAIEECVRLRPDIVVLDISEGEGDLEAILSLLNKTGKIPVLMLSPASSPALRPLVAAGLAGFLLKDASGDELRDAIASLRMGGCFIDRRYQEHVVDTVFQKGRRKRGNGAHLSSREEQILRSIVRGFTNAEIARHLRLSLKTVETYRSRLCKKLGLRTRADLVIYASAAGLISSPALDS